MGQGIGLLCSGTQGTDASPTPQVHCRPWVRGARSPGAEPDSAARLPGLKFQLNATLGDVLSSGHLTELCEDPVVPAVRVRQCPDTHQLWRAGAPDNARGGRELGSHPGEWLGGWSPQTRPDGCPLTCQSRCHPSPCPAPRTDGWCTVGSRSVGRYPGEQKPIISKVSKAVMGPPD